MQRAQRFAPRLHFVGMCGSFDGHLSNEGYDSVDFGIDAVDLLEVLGQRIACGKSLRTNELSHLDCAGETKRGGCGFGFKGRNREKRSGGNSCQDFAPSQLVWDHAEDSIIPVRNGRSPTSEIAFVQTTGGDEVVENRVWRLHKVLVPRSLFTRQ